MKKAKILVIASLGPRPYLGGIQNVVDTILDSGLKNDYDFSVFDTYNAPDTERKIGSKIFFAFKLLCGSISVIVKNKPQLVHIHYCSKADFWKHSLCLMVAKITGKCTIFHLHGGSFDKIYNRYGNLQKYLVSFFLRKADVQVALSEYWKKILSKISMKKNICILQNPINCRGIVISDFNHKPVGNKIVLLGSLGKRKGHYDVLSAASLVAAKYSDASFMFAGIDEDYKATEKLKKIAKLKNLEENVKFLGAVTGDAKDRLIKEAKIIILPSYGENLPISILEGMAYGKPVISTRVGGIPEVIENNVNGILIDMGDWQALGDKIIDLLENDELRITIGKNAFYRVREKWDVKKIRNDYNLLYLKLINRK